MFSVSNEEKQFYYKVQQVNVGTTSKGKPFTFISISNRKKDSNKYENAKLMYWDKAEIKKDDFVAFFNVAGVEQYSFSPSGTLKTYTGINIGTTKIMVKPPKEKDEKPKESAEPQVQEQQSQNQPIPEKNYQPIEDDSLPF